MPVVRHTDRAAADSVALDAIIREAGFFDGGVDDAEKNSAFVVRDFELQ